MYNMDVRFLLKPTKDSLEKKVPYGSYKVPATTPASPATVASPHSSFPSLLSLTEPEDMIISSAATSPINGLSPFATVDKTPLRSLGNLSIPFILIRPKLNILY
jgi:hypothetical protein